MYDSEEFQATIELAREHWKSFDHRRQYEWKVNLALWPAFALLIGFGVGNATALSNVGRILLAVAHVLIWVLYLLWTVNLHSRNEYDLTYAEHYKARAAAALDGRPFEEELALPNREFSLGSFRQLKTWSPLIQALFTTIMVGTSLLIWLLPDALLHQ